MEDIQKLENNSGNNALNNHGIQNTYTYFGSYNIVKPLLLNNQNNKFRVYNNIVNFKNIVQSSVTFIFVSIFISILLLLAGFDIVFWKIVLMYQTALIMCLFFARYMSKKTYLTLKNDEIIFESQENINLNYSDIRSYLIKKDLHGYSIYLYSKDSVLPTIEFNIESIHSANAIVEFLNDKIYVKLTA